MFDGSPKTGKKKKPSYSPHRVRENYSYSIQEVAELTKVDVTTVRRWIRVEGLERIPETRPYLIHSGQLRAFLEKKNSARKQSCSEGKVFCLKCRAPREPKTGSATITELPNNTVRYSASCTVCDTRINRVISNKDHMLARFLDGAEISLNESRCLPRACSLEEEKQLCLNLTP